MADIQAALVNFTLNTSTGNQTISHGSATFTPKAAIFYVPRDTTIGSDGISTHVSFTQGVATAANEWSSSHGAEYNQSRADSRRYFDGGACLSIIDPASNNTLDALATFVSFGSGSVTINLGTAPGTAYEGTVLLLGGSDLSVAAGLITPNTTQDGTATPGSAPGFQSDLILFSGQTVDYSTSGVWSNDINSFYGMCDGSLNQAGIGHSNDDNAADMVVSLTAFNNRIGAEFTPSSRAIAASFEVTNISSTTFTVTTRAGSASAQDIGYLAMALGGGDAWVGALASQSGTGNKSWTDPAFEPSLAFIATPLVATANSPQSGNDAGSSAVQMYDGTDTAAMVIMDRDAVASSSTTLNEIRSVFRMRNYANTITHTGTWSSFDTNGFTINFSVNSEAANDVWPAWAIGVGSTAAAYSITGALTISASIAGAMIEGRTIAGAQQIDLAIAAGMAEGREIAGAQQIDLAVAADMAFGINYEIAGAQQIDLAVVADMAEGRTIAGAQQIDLAIAADMAEGRTIAGAQQIDLAVVADMAEGRAIAGAQQIDLAVAAGMIEGRTIDGALQIDLAVGAVMAFAGGNQISGAVTIAAAVAGAMIEGRAFDGAQQIALAVAADMAEGRTIAGAQQIDLAVAAGMAFGSGQEIAGALQIDLAVAAALAVGREIAGTQQILLLPAAVMLEGRALAGASNVSLAVAADFQLAGILTPGDVTFTPAGPGFAASQTGPGFAASHTGPGFIPSIKP